MIWCLINCSVAASESVRHRKPFTWHFQLSRDFCWHLCISPSIAFLFYDTKEAQPGSGDRKHCHFSSIKPPGRTDHNKFLLFLTRTAKARTPACTSCSLFLQSSRSCFHPLVYFMLRLQFWKQVLRCEDRKVAQTLVFHTGSDEKEQ